MVFLIKWSRSAQGLEEYLPSEWFMSEMVAQRAQHECLWRGENFTASCTVDVRGRKATLNYGNNKLNKQNGIEEGIATLTFADKSFSIIEKYDWKPRGFEESVQPFKCINDDLFEDAEGDRRIVLHMRFERSLALREKKLHGNLTPRCEVCNFLFEDDYGEIGRKFCEVHHRLPLNKGKRDSKLSNLALLCSNCHRMIHKTPKLEGQKGAIMSVEEFSAYVKKIKLDASRNAHNQRLSR